MVHSLLYHIHIPPGDFPQGNLEFDQFCPISRFSNPYCSWWSQKNMWLMVKWLFISLFFMILIVHIPLKSKRFSMWFFWILPNIFSHRSSHMDDSHVIAQYLGCLEQPWQLLQSNDGTCPNEFDDVPTKTPSISYFTSIHGYYHN